MFEKNRNWPFWRLALLIITTLMLVTACQVDWFVLRDVLTPTHALAKNEVGTVQFFFDAQNDASGSLTVDNEIIVVQVPEDWEITAGALEEFGISSVQMVPCVDEGLLATFDLNAESGMQLVAFWNTFSSGFDHVADRGYLRFLPDGATTAGVGIKAVYGRMNEATGEFDLIHPVGVTHFADVPLPSDTASVDITYSETTLSTPPAVLMVTNPEVTGFQGGGADVALDIDADGSAGANEYAYRLFIGPPGSSGTAVPLNLQTQLTSGSYQQGSTVQTLDLYTDPAEYNPTGIYYIDLPILQHPTDQMQVRLHGLPRDETFGFRAHALVADLSGGDPSTYVDLISVSTVSTAMSLITGTVTDDSGNPLTDIRVTAYRWNGSYWTDFTSDTTDVAGQYYIDVPEAGTYRVGFQDSAGQFLTEYYDDAPTLDSATDVVLSADIDVVFVGAVLVAAGHVTGTVYDISGNPLLDIAVHAYTWINSRWIWVAGASTLTDGTYEIGGLVTGNYRIAFRDYAEQFLTEYYNDAPTLDSADDVAVTAGVTTPGINTVLAPVGRVTGTVYDGSGNPLPHISVTAYAWINSRWVWVAGALTLTDGTYEIGGLVTGNYRLEFRDSAEQFMSEYYSDAPTLDSADDVAVEVWATTAGIDAILWPVATTIECPAGRDSLSIQGVTYPAGTQRTCQANIWLSAGPEVTVSNQADVAYVAPTIVLKPGFRVEAGGVFRAGSAVTSN